MVAYTSLRDDIYLLLLKDNSYSLYAMAIKAEPTGDEIKKWHVYQLSNDSAALFTNTHIIYDDVSREYMYKNGRIFLIEGNDYAKMNVEFLSEDAFILNRSYSEVLLFIRSSFAESLSNTVD